MSKEFIATEKDLQAMLNDHFDLPSEEDSKKNQIRILDDTVTVERAKVPMNQLPTAKTESLPSRFDASEDSTDYELEKVYNDTKQNLTSLSENAMSALDSLTSVAEDSQHPRAYEVVATLTKTVADIQKQMFDMFKDKRTIKEKKMVKQDEDLPQRITNNTAIVFTGDANAVDELIKKSLANLKDAKSTTDSTET